MKPHHVDFERMNGRWVAKVYSDDRTCYTWMGFPDRKTMEDSIREQLIPHGIPHTIEEEE